MLEAFSTPHDRTLTSVFLAACCAFAIAAVAVGGVNTLPEDFKYGRNPLGILLGFLAAAAFILAFVHPWRTARQFGSLYISSPFGLLILGILAIVLDDFARLLSAVPGLHGLLQALSYFAVFLAFWVCPSALLVGAVGSLAMFIRNRRRRTEAHDAAA